MPPYGGGIINRFAEIIRLTEIAQKTAAFYKPTFDCACVG